MRDEHQVAMGGQIADLREQQGWSQRALAEWVGLDQSAVSRIEAGHRRLSADELQRFADALHVTADVLLQGSFAPAPDQGFAPAPRAPLAPSARFSRLGVPASEEGGANGTVFATDQLEPVVEAGPPLEARDHRPLRPRAASPSPASRMAPGGDEQDRLLRVTAASSPRQLSKLASRTSGRHDLPHLAGLPVEVTAVAHDWFALGRLADAPEPAQLWSTGHSADGKPERLAHTDGALHPSPASGGALYDRVARFWRGELRVEPDDGPLPDLIPLLEEGYGAQVIVARPPGEGASQAGPATPGSSERPVAAAFTLDGVPFIFVNAARPVVLQRFALAHAFAHHVLAHGDVVDRRIEWSRNVPPEAAANDFAEEFLAPVRAVQRWCERRQLPRGMRLEDLLDLANAFGISVWSALFRSRAAGRVQGKQFHVLRGELKQAEWELLPRQAFLGGVRDTLSHLTPREALPPGAYGGPAVLRVPAPMRAWALTALRGGLLSLEDAAALLHLDGEALVEQLARLGLE